MTPVPQGPRRGCLSGKLLRRKQGTQHRPVRTQGFVCGGKRQLVKHEEWEQRFQFALSLLIWREGRYVLPHTHTDTHTRGGGDFAHAR